jgi:coenzyme F420-reducing hydrogenase beta subunit
MTKKNIQEISDTKQCYDCALCGDICHTSAISFFPDDEGFMYPKVNDDLCTMCTECYRKCPVNNDYELQNFLHPEVYAAWHKDEQVVSKSTSGGIFTAIAEHIFENGGVVYGAQFNDDMTLSHAKASNLEEMQKMRGSKYLQSNAEGIYNDMKSELKTGKPVLFVGLPCQTAGAKTYFKKYKNLVLVDIVCHGINSPGVFNEYKNYIENKYNDKIKSFSFREKKHSWMNPEVEISFRHSKTIKKPLSLDPFYSGYRKHLYVRECCFECKYTKEQRIGDITIGDFWGVPQEFYNNNGTSLVLVNSQKGQEVYKAISQNIVSHQSSFEIAKQKNPQLYKPSSISEKNRLMREEFFRMLHKGEHQKIFGSFIFGKPFPQLRKLRYYLMYLKKVFKYKHEH